MGPATEPARTLAALEDRAPQGGFPHAGPRFGRPRRRRPTEGRRGLGFTGSLVPLAVSRQWVVRMSRGPWPAIVPLSAPGRPYWRAETPVASRIQRADAVSRPAPSDDLSRRSARRGRTQGPVRWQAANFPADTRPDGSKLAASLRREGQAGISGPGSPEPGNFSGQQGLRSQREVSGRVAPGASDCRVVHQPTPERSERKAASAASSSTPRARASSWATLPEADWKATGAVRQPPTGQFHAGAPRCPAPAHRTVSWGM